MKRLLKWLNRMPCGCVRAPLTQLGIAAGSYVALDCWRHGLLDWLCRRYVLVTDDRDCFYHDGYVEWRPWRWTARAYVDTAIARGMASQR